jgi:C-terminal processing protease CtpA/Prc
MWKKLAPSLLLTCLGCGGESPTSSSSMADQCSTLGQVQFVRNTLREIYLWYHELPDPDPAGFASPEAYLEAVRYRPLDTTFSFIADQAATDAFYSDSQFIGLGFSMQQTGATELRLGQVYPDSPASEAGLERGDRLLVINGKAVPELLQTGEIDTIFGPTQIGVVVTLRWRTERGVERQASLTKRLVTIPTVSATRVYELRRGPRVGYVFFRNFVTPSTAALDAAFAQLRAAEVSELVLDLRYNGGGLVSVAQHLASLIGGEATKDQVLVEFTHNDKNTARNSTLRFDLPASALSVPRLVVISTRASASASELVVNGLRPFIPVTLVGDTTFGKPVGQYLYDFCAKTLFPVAFQGRNARGEGDYFDGIPVDCAAADDLDHELGDPDEASLAESLEFIRTGRCSAGASAAAHALAQREALLGRGQPRGGWQQLLNAY